MSDVWDGAEEQIRVVVQPRSLEKESDDDDPDDENGNLFALTSVLMERGPSMLLC